MQLNWYLHTFLIPKIFIKKLWNVRLTIYLPNHIFLWDSLLSLSRKQLVFSTCETFNSFYVTSLWLFLESLKKMSNFLYFFILSSSFQNTKTTKSAFFDKLAFFLTNLMQKSQISGMWCLNFGFDNNSVAP